MGYLMIYNVKVDCLFKLTHVILYLTLYLSLIKQGEG